MKSAWKNKHRGAGRVAFLAVMRMQTPKCLTANSAEETVFYFAENDRTVVLLKVSPGRRMVEGKLV